MMLAIDEEVTDYIFNPKTVVLNRSISYGQLSNLVGYSNPFVKNAATAFQCNISARDIRFDLLNFNPNTDKARQAGQTMPSDRLKVLFQGYF